MLEIDRLGEDASHITDFNLHKIGHLSSCTHLNLHCNRLQTLVGLPHCNLTSLTELNLSSNDFSSSRLPELSHLPLLRILDLSANKLQSVLDLPFLPGLESLIVAHNILSSLDGLNDNVPNLIKLDVRNNILNDRQDLLPVSLLTNLRNLLVGGKQRSEIFKNADEVIQIFECNSSIETVDCRSKPQWMAESTQLSTSTPIQTPRFDRASRLWQNRLIEKADEKRDRENKRNEERYLEARRADSHDMMVKHEREKSRITALSRGMRALSMHAARGVLSRRCQRKCEKEVLHAMTLNEEKIKSLVQERMCLESDKVVEVMRRNEIELEQCRESERQVMERIQAEHSSALENAVCSAKGFYSLQLHAVRSAAERALEKSETARRETLEKYKELEAIHAEHLREVAGKIDAERESREAETRRIELLTETRHDAEKELTALQCKAFHSLHLHTIVRKERRLSEEQVMESLTLLECERRSYEDHVQVLYRNLEANKQALQGLQLASSMTAVEDTHSLKDKDDQIECLQEQLRGAKDEIGILVESAALLRHTDMRLTAEKVADTALITELRRLIGDKDDAYAVKELEMQGALEKQTQEHGLLKESHTSLQRKAERAVKRLNSVHDAFLEAVEDRDHLAQALNDLNDEKAERESTIVELGSCVRQLQTALRNLTHNLSLAQAKAHTSHAVQLLPEKSVRGVEGDFDVGEHRRDGNMRQSTSSRSCDDDGGDGDGDGDAGGFLALNESTDFLNRSSFKSAKERNESNGGRSDSAEPEGDCTGGVGNSPLTSTRMNNAACPSDSDLPADSDGSTASNLATLRAELVHRTLDLQDAERSIADLTKSQTNLQAALQVKVCILSDQTDIILDLREKLSKASQDREELQDSLMEVEHLFNSSESQRKDIADNLEWRFQREMQLNTKIKSLEGVNSKLRHALEMEEEEEKDSSSSDSEGESGVEEEDEEVGVEDEYREKAEQKKETYVAAAHTVQAVIKKGKTRDGDLGIADVAYREERISSTQTNHSPHSIKPVSSPSSSSSSSGLGKRLRLSSRKELKEWVIRLTDEQHRFHQSCEVDKNTKAELVKAFQVTIEEQRAEVLRCTSVAKEAVTGMEEAAKKLLCKENENIRIAHSVIQLEGKLEQLCLKLQIEQERNSMMSEGFLNERKYLSRTVRQLQSESSSKEEDFKRLRGVTDQLRLLVASGSLHN